MSTSTFSTSSHPGEMLSWSYPEGMLDRDQRTIFTLETKSETFPLNCTTSCCDDCKPKYFNIRQKCSKSKVNCDSNSFLKKNIAWLLWKLNKYLLVLLCLWIITLKNFQPATIMAMPVHMSDYNKHPKSVANLKLQLINPCGFDDENPGSDSTDSRQTFQLENKDVKFFLGKIQRSANTGLSDFKTGYLHKFLRFDFQISYEMLDDIIRHHEAWKHQFNPNLLPSGKHLEIEFSKDLSEATKLFAEQSARKFDVTNENDKKQLLELLDDCDERLQRLFVVFYQMHQNLDNFNINFRQDEFATSNIRKVYAKAIDIIRTCLCDIRSAMYKLYETSGMENHQMGIVDVDYILDNPFKTDSIGDWVNVRQLHDQLEYMTRIFGIWFNEIY